MSHNYSEEFPLALGCPLTLPLQLLPNLMTVFVTGSGTEVCFNWLINKTKLGSRIKIFVFSIKPGCHNLRTITMNTWHNFLAHHSNLFLKKQYLNTTIIVKILYKCDFAFWGTIKYCICKHCWEEGCIGKYIPRGPRDFPRAGILHPKAREIAQGHSRGPRGSKSCPREISRPKGDGFPNTSRNEAVYSHFLGGYALEEIQISTAETRISILPYQTLFVTGGWSNLRRLKSCWINWSQVDSSSTRPTHSPLLLFLRGNLTILSAGKYWQQMALASVSVSSSLGQKNL